MSEQTTKWYDHEGRILEAPYSDTPTAYRWDDQRTHRISNPTMGRLTQAITHCGKRALEVPGRGDVDCPECITDVIKPKPCAYPGCKRTYVLYHLGDEGKSSRGWAHNVNGESLCPDHKETPSTKQ